MTDNITGHLYAIENWGGELAAAYYEKTGDNRWEPKWYRIERKEYDRIRYEMVEFEEDEQPCSSIRFYSLKKQQKAAALEEYTDALNERNKMAADAAAGYL